MSDVDRWGEDRSPPRPRDRRRRFRPIVLVALLMLGLVIVLSALRLGSVAPKNGTLEDGATYAKVTGKVCYKGEPLPSGSIMFFGSEGTGPAFGPIDDGIYTVMAAPLGEVQISVRVFPPRGLKGIPEKYANPNTSGLRCRIKIGDNVVDIDLTD